MKCNKAREKRLWELYRLTPEEWEKIFKYQKGVCAISGRPTKKSTLNTDHNHISGEVRGLLSFKFNKGLQYFEDNPALLRAAADYLENPPATKALGRTVYGMIGRAKMGKKVKVYGSTSGPIKNERKNAGRRKHRKSGSKLRKGL